MIVSSLSRRFGQFLVGGLCAGALVAVRGDARACGCFTPPDPSVPVVQAGERIVFAAKDGQIEAHIQIQYKGDAKEFGWLLPLPTQPTLDLGSDELFNQIVARTQPKYRLTTNNTCGNSPAFAFGGANDSAEAPKGAGESSPLVIQDSIGPYDYAVLKADSKQPMLDWLKANNYFVPAGTDTVVSQYVHAGAFFLALKLKSGKSAGDLQPVVVRYPSDLPMIPIVLTSVTAQLDMGIQVWMLGAGRAIPRNYYHTVINDAAIDWQTSGSNYNDVIIRATKEAEGRHTFVTEFAGASTVMQGALVPAGRFGSAADLKVITDPVQYVEYLQQHQFAALSTSQNNGFPFNPGFNTFGGPLLALLEAAIPEPPAIAAQNVTPAQFYQGIANWLGDYRAQHPDQFVGIDYKYDPIKLTNDIWDRVVTPVQKADALFADYKYLTRLYTTLSPEQMNRDPVFSYNPSLPDVSNVHNATLTINCNWLGHTDTSTLVTEQGFVLQYPGGTTITAPTSVPGSLRIEVLRETGAPEVLTDNLGAIQSQLGQGGGCNVSARGDAGRGLTVLVLGALALVASRRRRR